MDWTVPVIVPGGHGDHWGWMSGRGWAGVPFRSLMLAILSVELQEGTRATRAACARGAHACLCLRAWLPWSLAAEKLHAGPSDVLCHAKLVRSAGRGRPGYFRAHSQEAAARIGSPSSRKGTPGFVRLRWGIYSTAVALFKISRIFSS